MPPRRLLCFAHYLTKMNRVRDRTSAGASAQAARRRFQYTKATAYVKNDARETGTHIEAVRRNLKETPP